MELTAGHCTGFCLTLWGLSPFCLLRLSHAAWWKHIEDTHSATFQFFYNRKMPRQKAAWRKRCQHRTVIRHEAFVWRGIKSQAIYSHLTYLLWNAAVICQETTNPVSVCATTVLASDIIHHDFTSLEVRKLFCDWNRFYAHCCSELKRETLWVGVSMTQVSLSHFFLNFFFCTRETHRYTISQCKWENGVENCVTNGRFCSFPLQAQSSRPCGAPTNIGGWIKNNCHRSGLIWSRTSSAWSERSRGGVWWSTHPVSGHRIYHQEQLQRNRQRRAISSSAHHWSANHDSEICWPAAFPPSSLADGIRSSRFCCLQSEWGWILVARKSGSF